MDSSPEQTIIGAPLPHDSAILHVTGRAQYVDDTVPVRGQGYVAVGASSIACGRVVSINLDRVRAAHGVLDVIRARDVPGELDIGPVYPGDPLLVDDRVSYLGQPVFAVLARSHDLARAAVRLADIEYEEEAALLDLGEARDTQQWVRPPHRMQRGDIDAALAAAECRIEGELVVGGQEHFYLEGQASIAIPEDDGGVTILTSTQNPTEAQKLAASVLGIGMQQVNVETRRMGGGFGGKETHGSPWSCLAALFALRNGIRVVCRLSRRDDMVMTGKRHNFINRYQAGFTPDGMIVGARYELAAQCGYSPDLSDAIVDRAMFHADNAYYLPAVTIDGLRCRTNTVSNTAFRGFGGPQGVIAAETVIDEIAWHTGKDPLTIRKQNLYDTASRNLTPYHQVIDSWPLPRIIGELEEEGDYWSRRQQVAAFNDSHAILKKGLALTPVKFGISFTVAHLNQAGALIHVYTDGTIHLNHGGTEMGQGLMIKVAQIVASEFGVDPGVIRISATRTDKVPNTSPTAASSGTDINGMAALNAARTIKQRLVEFLAERDHVSSTEIRFSDGEVRVADRIHSFAEVVHDAWFNRISLSATGYYRTPGIHYDRAAAAGRPFFYFATGAAISEVAIDTLTGESRVLRVDILHDAGRSINPAVDIGQVEGGYIQGLGWLTSEELVWDGKGRLGSDGPATYKIPAIGDTPPVFNVRLLDNNPNSEDTVFRSKAVGEPPLMLAISAWCAIRDAIGAVGNSPEFPYLEAPATPEHILEALSRRNTA